ncbi:MAG: hypothetical protein WC081_05660 [Candidatus Ratteibacteria bacterium]
MKKNDYWYEDDDNWYYEKSRELKLSKNCPFSSPQLCPRYYESVKILQNVKLVKGIGSKIDKKLAQKWEEHPMKPCMQEEESGISFEGDPGTSSYKTLSISNFCPELTFKQFGIFASSLARLTDIIDTEPIPNYVKRMKADKDDWKWEYHRVDHQHYSDCKEYLWLSSHETAIQKTIYPEVLKPTEKEQNPCFDKESGKFMFNGKTIKLGKGDLKYKIVEFLYDNPKKMFPYVEIAVTIGLIEKMATEITDPGLMEAAHKLKKEGNEAMAKAIARLGTQNAISVPIIKRVNQLVFDIKKSLNLPNKDESLFVCNKGYMMKR